MLVTMMSYIALTIALTRVLVVFNGIAVMLIKRKRDIQWGRSMKIAFLEPFMLMAVVTWLWMFGAMAPMSDSFLLMVAVGLLCSCFGLILFVWSFVAYRGVGTGHYVDDDQCVVETGPYALMRHPMYCAAIYIWLGLALTHLDWTILTLTFAYVIPAYYFYARDEESMMVSAFRKSYSDYAQRVPMLFPKLLSIWE